MQSENVNNPAVSHPNNTGGHPGRGAEETQRLEVIQGRLDALNTNGPARYLIAFNDFKAHAASDVAFLLSLVTAERQRVALLEKALIGISGCPAVLSIADRIAASAERRGLRNPLAVAAELLQEDGEDE